MNALISPHSKIWCGFLFNCCPSDYSVGISHCGFNLPLSTSEIEHFFLYLWATWFLLLWKSLLWVLHGAFFLHINYRSSLSCFWKKTATDVGILNGIVLNQKTSSASLDINMIGSSYLKTCFISAKLFLVKRFIIFSINFKSLLFNPRYFTCFIIVVV